MGKPVKLSDEVVKKLDELKHTGQSYDGVLRELLVKLGYPFGKKKEIGESGK